MTTIKNTLKMLVTKAKEFVFRRDPIFDPSVINPPNWRERQIQNQKIDAEFKENLKAKGKEAHWSDRYDKDFENVKKEVVRVRENSE